MECAYEIKKAQEDERSDSEKKEAARTGRREEKTEE
jgi:hypothetical protein